MIKLATRTVLLVIIMAGIAVAADSTLSRDDMSFIAGLGISQLQVEKLSSADTLRVKQMLKNNATQEVKCFIVTRWFVQSLLTSDNIPELSYYEKEQLRKSLDFKYIADVKEQLLTFNALLYHNIDPEKIDHPLKAR